MITPPSQEEMVSSRWKKEHKYEKFQSEKRVKRSKETRKTSLVHDDHHYEVLIPGQLSHDEMYPRGDHRMSAPMLPPPFHPPLPPRNSIKRTNQSQETRGRSESQARNGNNSSIQEPLPSSPRELFVNHTHTQSGGDLVQSHF